MAIALPRGIQAARWTTTEGEIRERFRVRIDRKAFKADKYFETLAEARDFLFESKTPRGRKRLTSDAAKALRDEPAAIDLSVISYQVLMYLNRYFPEAPKGEITDTSIMTARYRLLNLMTVKVSNLAFARLAKTGNPGTLGAFITYPKIEFGKISIHHLNEQVVNELVDARLSGIAVWNKKTKQYTTKMVSKATVMRDLSALRGFWSKLRHFNNFEFQRLEDRNSNPFRDCDKTNLKNYDVRRDDRIPEAAQTAVFEALAACKNPDMTRIFAIALTTGMRRNEILNLKKEWINLDDGVLELPSEITKTATARTVKLTPDAVAILQAVLAAKPNVNGRLFDYTTSGYNANWQRVKRWISENHPNNPEFKDILFHSARREFITQVLEKISEPALGIQYTTLKDVRYLISTFMRPKEEQASLDTYEGMMKSVGHKSKQTNLRYISPKKAK